MSYCPNCGSIIELNDKFCRSCGVSLSARTPPPPPGYSKPSGFPIKLQPTFENGLVIGVGVATIILGLFLFFFSLNSVYSQQTAYLEGEGIEVNYRLFGWGTIVSLMSISASLTIMGFYLLILGTLYQVKPKVRMIMQNYSYTCLFGRMLMFGGMGWNSFSVLFLVQSLYRPYRSVSAGVLLVNVVFVIAGLVALLIGVLLIRDSYLRSISSTKV